MYGATPLEDIPNYNVIVRGLTEWTGSDALGADQTSITDGIGGVQPGVAGSIEIAPGNFNVAGAPTIVNVRQKYIQGVDLRGVDEDAAGSIPGFGVVPNGVSLGAALGGTHESIFGQNPTRRYQVQLALGILTQEKLVPAKFMASQLAIEITLANANECMIFKPYGSGSLSSPPTYVVSNVNLIPEILEFDASYDESFLRGLQSGGVPIKFSTWNNYRFAVQGSTANLQIQERSRSVKSIFCLQRRQNATFPTDSGASFINTDLTTTDGASTLQDYQYRIGGRYFPAAPVQCSVGTAATVSNNGVEAYTELAKAINILGDNRLSTNVSAVKWGLNPGVLNSFASAVQTTLQENDYDTALIGFKFTGSPVIRDLSSQTTASSGDMGSQCFTMAIDLETSNGLEISGLNAEEQSDISLLARYSASQSSDMIYEVFTYIDAMIVLKENNVLELIQ